MNKVSVISALVASLYEISTEVKEVIDAHTYCVHIIIVVALTLLALILNHPVLLHFRRNLTIAHQFQNL